MNIPFKGPKRCGRRLGCSEMASCKPGCWWGCWWWSCAKKCLMNDRSVSNSDTVLSTAACICPADQRSLWDILWSCLATIFACSWVSVHPNIPASNESSRRIFLRRLELMFWAVVSPEMIITWAVRQWSGARHLEKKYKGELSKINVSNFSAIQN